jgi:hypothetical protein
MARLKRVLARTALALVTLASTYLALLVAPDPLFAHARAGAFLVVHADTPLPPETDAVIALAEARIASSPLFDETRAHDVYVCAAPWRWSLLSGVNARAGAVAMAPIGRSVFTREARFERNRLVGASGREAEPPRTIDYYLAHEVTHTLTADALGLAYFDLPEWVREGYADYVARGDTFDYDAVRARFVRGERDLDPRSSGVYLRHVLLVSHLLDREGWDVRSLLRAPPDHDALEQRVRDDVVLPRD